LYFERAEDLYKDSPLERARCLRELCWACTVQATQSFASELYVNPQELLGNAWEYALKAVNLLKECDDRGLDYAIACNVLAETGLKCADNDVEVNLLYEYMYPDGTVIEDNFLLVPSSDSPDSLFTFLNDKLLSTTYSEALRDTAVFCRTDKNLASISLRRGDTEEALKLLHEVMEKEKKEAPPDFALAHHATTLEKLGDIYLKNRQRGDPVFYFQSALDIRLKVFGADHHDIVRVRRKLSELAQAG
jgi:tetratricopeptide (TPR) repeat protein